MENVEKGVRLSHISHSAATRLFFRRNGKKGRGLRYIYKEKKLKFCFTVDELPQLLYSYQRGAGLRPDAARRVVGCHRIRWSDTIGFNGRMSCDCRSDSTGLSILDELLTKENLKELNIDVETEAIIRNYVLKSKAFYDCDITNIELYEERIAAWTSHDGSSDGSSARRLFRIAVSCLYDERSAEYDTYGSDMVIHLYFHLLMDLGKGYCKQFRHYLESKLPHKTG